MISGNCVLMTSVFGFSISTPESSLALVDDRLYHRARRLPLKFDFQFVGINNTQPKLPCNVFEIMTQREMFYAPSLPKSSVHSAFRFRSDADTVGLAPLIALTKSLTWSGGSSNSSVST